MFVTRETGVGDYTKSDPISVYQEFILFGKQDKLEYNDSWK